MERSIQDIARLSGATSRTLRHYGDIGLLEPSRIGVNGYRYYDDDALVRLQRILLLRELGLGLPAIADLLAGDREQADALERHLRWLRLEKDRLDRQIGSVEATIRRMRGGEELMAEEMFDGFDHTQYRQEVEERWGTEAYASGDRWWRSLTAAEKAKFREDQKSVQADYLAAIAAGASVESEEVLAITRRHYDWLVVGWQGRRPTPEQFVGMGDLYVADERFGAKYGGLEGATFVRNAMAAFAERNL
ncbi:MerR family transcriptional regulator [Lacisediminihabitans profunda]|uniref:MerR family transcriptional regulator n=1 Tax=Lacisediminihabitans profunda TaxID=2594790 RepID=A0A5C8UPU4_9MICO|nr:MerR family transcriptional regulator [Lacisediminihabitans profunda]TXN30461.1 MerR family transcriptional regulator [Lacisediminihabitans profunda]